MHAQNSQWPSQTGALRWNSRPSPKSEHWSDLGIFTSEGEGEGEGEYGVFRGKLCIVLMRYNETISRERHQKNARRTAANGGWCPSRIVAGAGPVRAGLGAAAGRS